MSASGPSYYRSYEDFEREQLQPLRKIGFSLDDLEDEAAFRPAREENDNASELEELNFG